MIAYLYFVRDVTVCQVDEYASLTQEEKTQLKELLKPKSSNGPASPPNESIESNADGRENVYSVYTLCCYST